MSAPDRRRTAALDAVNGPLGSPRRHLRRTDSTNLCAREMAVAGAPHGTLVTAAAQTAGRGRQGRSWSAPPGTSLLASLVIRGPSPLLSLTAGLAVARTAQAFDDAGRRALVKWPNDVLLDGAKVAGILVEGRPAAGWAVLGIGLNVAVDPAALPAELVSRAATLGRDAAELEPCLRRLLAELERALAAAPEVILEELRARDALRGRPVRWAAGAGMAVGLDDSGRLLVGTDTGTVALDAGEVHLGV